jgi:hypothetical protein
MYAWIRQTGARRFAISEAPPLAAALILAELFYKFHSFTLECAAFLVTWAGLSWLQEKAGGLLSSRQAAPGKES